MKGGSKIDGNHLEPIADRDYIARGDLSEIFLSKTLKYSKIVTPRNLSQLSNLFHCV